MNRLGQEGLAWVPTLGNILTLLCFGLCLWVSARFTEVGLQIPPPVTLRYSRDALHLLLRPWDMWELVARGKGRNLTNSR